MNQIKPRYNMIFRPIDPSDLDDIGSQRYLDTMKRLRALKSIDQIIIQEDLAPQTVTGNANS